MSHDARLIASAIGAVMLLILLIARFKINSFVALIVASLAAGLFCGMNLPDVAKAFGEGVGAVLGSVAMVIGLGAIIGKMLAVSGGAEVIAETITTWVGQASRLSRRRLAGVSGRPAGETPTGTGGDACPTTAEKRLPWAIVVIALIVGLPVFFPVGLVLLTPIIAAIARRSGVNFLTLALPMAAGLSVAHGLVPPHPGPMVAIETLHADAGKTIIYSLIIGVPAALVSGPIFAKWISTKSAAPEIAAPAHQGPMPTFLATVLTVSLPILLMLLSTAADLTLAKNHPLRAAANFAGSPVCALTISVLVSFFAFGLRRGFSGQDILKFSEESLGPTASAILVVGAGGGFNKILVVSGVGEVISRAATSAQLSPLLLGWVVAALIRIATGSATVAISTAAGILAPIAAAQPVNRELLVVVMGAGSLILSHVNDGGFWFVKEYLNLSVAQTLRTWTVIETIIALVGLAGGLALNQFL